MIGKEIGYRLREEPIKICDTTLYRLYVDGQYKGTFNRYELYDEYDHYDQIAKENNWKNIYE